LQWIWSPCAPLTCLKLPEEIDVRRNGKWKEKMNMARKK
jgi:hypothetical protein